MVDDDQGHRSTLATLLSDWGHRVTAVVDGESAVDACKNSPFDLVLMPTVGCEWNNRGKSEL